jgi:hypothetical protein
MSSHQEKKVNEKFVPLPDLPGRVYAEMVKEVLEQKGIPSYIRSDGVSDGYGVVGTGPIAKGFQLFVPESAVEFCLQIRNEMLNHI